MAQYIDRDALVAEIERLRDEKGTFYASDVLYNLEDFIDNLKVKDVDLDKTINDYFKDWKFDEELDIMVKPNNYSATFDDIKEVAKHFFELGLKSAQKGE